MISIADLEHTGILRGALYALPWVILPFVAVSRRRASRSLTEFDDTVPAVAERVSMVLPARNECQHIAACVVSLRASTWQNLEIIVVNDHSTDGTRELAIGAARGDERIRVIDAPDLPDGWFGKQWACHAGVIHATGSLLLFTDADTRHAPDLIARMVHARESRRADLISVAGSQEMRSFWEYAIQPVVFSILLTRYGGTTQMEKAKRSIDVIANGQCLMMTRAAYNTVGGHEAVRATVAEDLMLAQRAHGMGLRVSMVMGLQQLSTHMYSGLSAIIAGWMKNVYAGGRMSIGGGWIGQLIFPVALVVAPLALALPFFILLYLAAASVAGHAISMALLSWSVASAIALLAFFTAIKPLGERAAWQVVLVPLGALAFSLICCAAVLRGQSVEWKGRKYRASS